ncbi:TonB-dependent receptor [Flavobacterium sp.]|uniref:TonB-dependent receptor n=1 Tax=Flavobacterium sp. TaxID=239 RepID=UPI00262B6A28|nr:TonB-dependent receptor [Flavobacterium sp.]
MKKYLVIVLLSAITFAQNNKQNIRGIVIDKLSQTPIIGATVQINNSEKQTITDEKGYYILTDLTPNRYDIKVLSVGYKEVTISNVIVTSGKEVILDITLEDEYKKLDEVVIVSKNNTGTVNKLASVSARTFSTEDVNRYAGGRSDAARLVANFAGVSATNDNRNDIVIRGNSPIGVLWRIDGMSVTNPNHFATAGTTGGAVSAINTNFLKNSDFFTSAFPAEYGNATAGVFDLGFRNGNNKKRETTIQLGVITGAEITTEGPINKEKGSSYLFGYRYTLASLAQAVGINIGTTATPSFQDLSFKINGATSSFGKLSAFGVLASSSINLDGDGGTIFGGNGGVDLGSKIGIIGVNHFKQINKSSNISTTIGINYSQSEQTNSSQNSITNTKYNTEEIDFKNTGIVVASNFSSKINSNLFLKVGIQNEFIRTDQFYQYRTGQTDAWTQRLNGVNNTSLSQLYAHFKYRFGAKTTLNAGFHSQYFHLNQSFAFEPRLGFIYSINTKSSFNLGYGLHAQNQPIATYFVQNTAINGSVVQTNRNLDFTKSHHFVIGYTINPIKDWRIKAELYYQYLYDVPVNNFSSDYSILNTGASFKLDLEDNLVNKGTGKNYGAEITIEKFFSNGYYGLFTSSLYDSKYKASDGVERNTAFNGKYVFNILGGKEWKIGKENRNVFAVDIKFTNAGGRAYTPIDLASSQASGTEVLSSDAYSDFYKNYYRLDIKGGLVINSKNKKLSQTISLDIQNVTNHNNVFSQSYDRQKNTLRYTYQLGLFPNLLYKIQF